MRRVAVTVSLVLIFCAAAAPADSDEGKLVVDVVRDGNSYRVVSAVAYPNAPAPVDIGGNARFRLLGDDGAELAAGRVRIPTFIAQEYADETGQLHGTLERVERFTISLPLASGIAGIELKRGNTLLLDENISPEPFMPRRTSAARADEPISYAPLLKALTEEPNRIATAQAVAGPAKQDKIKGTVTVKGVKDVSLTRAEIYLYPIDGDFNNRYETTSDETGRFSIKVPRGVYRVSAYCFYRDPDFGGREVLLYPGNEIVTAFDSSQKTLKLKWKKSTLFVGQLVYGGTPVPGEVYIVDRIARPETHKTYSVARMLTDDDGRFALRLPRKNFVMVAIPRPGSAAGELLSIVKVKKSNVDVPISLPTLGAVGGDALKKIWDAGPEGAHLNIMLLADAYTGGFESFTDINGNGWWDGDLLLDLNNNGAADNGEYYNDRNSNRVYDAPEPFTDTNGDGICNRYERARFELDAALAASGLLDFPPFDRYGDAVNIYTYWQASQHGVPRFTQFTQWQNMNTAWGVYGTGTNGFQSARIDTSPKSAAQALLPGARELVPVVLSQDPFNALRANAQFGFGRILLSAEDHRAGAVLIHEIGHSVGNLWDEYLYSDTPSQYTGGEPSSLNVTRFTVPAQAKWSNLINAGIPVPTPENRDGYGLFEGAGSYSNGIYRPTAISMMRSTAYPFFIVNEQAMAAVLEQFR